MWVVDEKKERQRNELQGEVSGLMHRISRELARSEQVASEFCHAASGAPSGLGDLMAGDCRKAGELLARALQDMRACKECLDGVDVMKWVDDGDGI